MAGRPQKPAHQLQDQRPQRRRPETTIVDAAPRSLRAVGEDDTPPPPAGLLKATKLAWVEFWSSPVAAMVRPSDMSALRRWAFLLDEHQRALRAYRSQRLTTGSKGQMRRNPAFDVAQSLAAELRQLEDKLGMNPLARMRLGLALVEQQNELDKMNERMNGDDDEGVEWVT